MSLSEKNIVLFEAYTQGQLSEKEAKDFEARLDYDQELAEAFEEYTVVENSLKQVYRDELKQRLIAIDKDLDEPEEKPKPSKIIWLTSAVAASILIGLFAVALFGESNHTRLAEKYWPVEEGLPVRMSTKNPYDAAMNAYKLERWNEAKQLLLELPANDTTHYFSGIVAFKQSDYPQAIRFLEQIPVASSWYHQSQFQLALTHLANGRLEEARSMLKRIAETDSTPYRNEAALVLQEF